MFVVFADYGDGPVLLDVASSLISAERIIRADYGRWVRLAPMQPLEWAPGCDAARAPAPKEGDEWGGEGELHWWYQETCPSDPSLVRYPY